MNDKEREARSELQPLRPGRVAEIIRMAIPLVAVAAEAGDDSRFELLANGGLVPGADAPHVKR